MAVTSVVFQYESSYVIQQNGEKTRICQFLAYCEYATDTGGDVMASGLVPLFHPQEALLPGRVVRIEKGSTPAKNLYEVTVEYTNVTSNNNAREEDLSQIVPRDRRARIRQSGTRIQEPTLKDINGKWIMTAAKKLFSPPPMVNKSIRIFNIEKDFDTRPSLIMDYQDAINDADIEIDGVEVKKGTAYVSDVNVSDWKVERVGNTDYRYVTVNIQIEVKKPNPEILDENDEPASPWQTNLVNQGWHYLVSTETPVPAEIDITKAKRFRAKDETGADSTEMVYLKKDGGLLTDQQVRSDPTLVNYRSFKTYEEKDFSALPLT